MGAENEIEKFDPSTLMQGVKDRIKATFVGMIPEDKWDQLVQTEIDNFFTPKKMKICSAGHQSSGYSYGNNKEKFESDTILEVEMSPFQQIIWDMCAEKSRAKLKEHIITEYFDNKWDLDKDKLNESMKNVIVEASPLVMAKLFEQMTFGAANQVRQMFNNIR